MSTKGRDGGLKEKRGRSPSLSLEQRMRSPTPSPTPSVLDRKKGSVLAESRKVSGSNPKKQPLDKTKPPRSSPPSKVTSTRSKPNEKNVTRPSTKITGLTKPKDAVTSRLPLGSKNVVNVKETTNASGKKQTKKGLENVVPEQNRIVSDVPRSSKLDLVIVTHKDDNKTIPVFNKIRMSDCDKQILDDVNGDILNNAVEIETPLCDPIDLSGNHNVPESEIRSRDNVPIDGNVDQILNNAVEIETPRCDRIDLSGNQETPESETRSRDNATIDGSVDRAHTNDPDNKIIVQDQENETSEIASDRLLVPNPPKTVVDQENDEGPEIERVAQDPYVGSKIVEHIDSNDQDPKEPEEEKLEPKEPEHQETKVPEEPKNQETENPEISPDHEETEVQEEPEIQETEIPEIVPENQETEIPEEEPENQETENPEELRDHEETEPKEEAKHEETEGKEAESGSKMKKKEVVAHGKKEMGIAYNDVIEETVSKLRRQRKNRVLALVGAFETVISLESNE